MDTMSYAKYLATFLPLLVAIVNPAVASFFSRAHWPELITQGLTVVLSAGEAFAAQLFQSDNFNFSRATLIALGTYILSALARSQFWANTRTDAKLLAFPNRSSGDVSEVSASSLVNPEMEDLSVDASTLLSPNPRPSPNPPDQPRHAA